VRALKDREVGGGRLEEQTTADSDERSLVAV
jgi:hypothetical protein